MRSGEALVIVIDFDPSEVLPRFVGLDPLELVTYLKRLKRMVASHIESSLPDSYEGELELHRIVWLKDNNNEPELRSLAFRFLLDLLRDLGRENAEYAEKGLPPVKFHAGLSEGTVDFGPRGVLGEGAVKASACAEQARKNKAILVMTSDIMKDVPREIWQSTDLQSFSTGSSDYIQVNESALVRLSAIFPIGILLRLRAMYSKAFNRLKPITHLKNNSTRE